jgi:hypothetical protein
MWCPKWTRTNRNDFEGVASDPVTSGTVGTLGWVKRIVLETVIVAIEQSLQRM